MFGSMQHSPKVAHKKYNWRRWLALPLSLLLAVHVAAQQPIRAYMDLQIHPTMHEAYPFFQQGLLYFDAQHPPKASYKHLLTNVNHANYLAHNPGARIICNGAITNEWVRSKKKARREILKQIQYVNDFAAAHPDEFVVAKSPQEVRTLVLETDKTVIIHSIEGGNKLVNSPADAEFWAGQGVAFITLIHLRDTKYGAAAILPDMSTRIINLRGVLRREKNRGLTDHGRQAIRWLANAGIMTDITHMADGTRTDALAYMQAQGIVPISTHDGFKPIQNHPRAIPPAEVIQIYQNGGMISLPISGYSTLPHHPDSNYQRQLDSLPCHCPGSVDSYKFTYLAVKEFVEGNVPTITGDAAMTFEALSEADKVQFAIGYQSDFNGWLNHSRPRYGKDGCFPLQADTAYTEIETLGLAHPGLMPAYWDLLAGEGVDLQPIQRASERFLQIWQQFLDKKGTFEE
jgi:microsomal dipeptidase-like Zn-dependent dipeptidase